VLNDVIDVAEGVGVAEGVVEGVVVAEGVVAEGVGVAEGVVVDGIEGGNRYWIGIKGLE